MSNSTENQKPGTASEVGGIGTVKVDGETVYDTADTFASEVNAVVTNATKPVEDSVNQAAEEAAKASKGSHYPRESSGNGKSQAGGYGTSYSNPWRHVNKWGIWIGVILVTLGSLIFLDMLSGTVPALENIFGGYSFWRFWPLLIIFGGLAIAFSPTKDSPDPRINDSFSLLRFSEGLFVATIGLVLLGNSLALVSWLSWPAMLSFWPLILVIIGLSVLSYALKTQWFSVAAYLLSILTLLAVASSMWTGQAPLAEPFATLAEFGSFRGMDLFNIGSMVEAPWR